MKENAKETKVLFDKDVLATRIFDLRTGANKEEKIYTQRELCEAIKEKTGVEISISKLSRLEKGDDKQMPSINTLLAISDFFDVSLEYLVGLSDISEKNINYKEVNKMFGLSQRAMEKMKYMKTHTDLIWPENYKKFGEMDFLNMVIVDFPKLFSVPAVAYLRAYEEYKEFCKKYGKKKNGKNSTRVLDLDAFPIEIEESMIEQAQDLKNMVDLKKFEMLSAWETFLRKIRNALIMEDSQS